MNKRPTWNEVWMRTALTLAERSYDPRYKVGAVIVSEDNTQVLSVGYNGNHAGGPNAVESSEPGQSGMIHAEINALIKLDYNNPKKKKLYLTLSPCRMCAKSIVNAGIQKVLYQEEYRDRTGLEILLAAGINVEKYTVPS